jgi:DMSO/TMAO reductase YedYZ molybdopterin-dependent catalytic subunit/thiosulfate reductase cytochrome b subunit
MDDMLQLGFPLWVRLTHLFNFLFITLLIRSGIEIIGAHPKFYWRDDSLPGSEWFRFTTKRMPKDRLWTSEDEVEPMSRWTALPGENNLGLGRHWHFWAATGWLLAGLIYVVLLFATPQWRRLLPTSWHIFPAAWQAIVDYIHLRLPPEGNPFNAIQQLTYCFIIFILSPLQIVTGIMMSPALGARFPWFPKMLGGRQAARSLHFIGLIVFSGFIVVHVSLVFAHGFGREMAKIVLGDEVSSYARATIIGLLAIAAVIVFHIWGTRYSLVSPSQAKRFLEIGVDPLRRLLFPHWVSRQEYQRISAYARINGKPPRNEIYERLAAGNFTDWRLEIGGLVKKNLSLSLDDLHHMRRQTQTTLHCCIQGWSYLAQWAGVPVSSIIEMCAPLPNARFLVFHSLDEKWERPDHGYYYEVIDLALGMQPQTILAYEMNGRPLPIAHGAPLRLRVENQLGYKMAKWINRIEVVNSFKHIGKGQGGWRDDLLHYYPLDAGL